jgi:hypothetical protein
MIAQELPALPTAAQMAADPTVSAAIAQAWTDSQAGDPDNRHEEGGWIVQDTRTGALSVVRWPKGTGSSINPGAPPQIPCSRVVGEFHTHPNPPVDEDGNTWEQGPSAGDENAANALGIPGIVRNAAGTEYYGPATGGLPHTPMPEEPEPLDASIEFLTWTIDGVPVPPGTYRVPLGTIIDIEYEVHVSGEEDAVVEVYETKWLSYHYGGPGEGNWIHAVNHPGAVTMSPPADKLEQETTINGELAPYCTEVFAPKCQEILLDVHVGWEQVVCVNYQQNVNWLRINPPYVPYATILQHGLDEEVLFDIYPFEQAPIDPTEPEIINLTAMACVQVQGDENPDNDCTDWCPGLTIEIESSEQPQQ